MIMAGGSACTNLTRVVGFISGKCNVIKDGAHYYDEHYYVVAIESKCKTCVSCAQLHRFDRFTVRLACRINAHIRAVY